MKRKILTSLLLITVLMLAVPAGIVMAKATSQTIEFDLSGSWSEDGVDPDTGDPIDVDYDAAVILTGKISEKGGAKYLSPLHGTLALDGMEYKIQVKQIKQSEPLYGDETRIDLPSINRYLIIAQTYGVVEANVEGNKFVGWLQWNSTTWYDYDDNIISTSGGSDLTLNGISDGKLVSGYLFGDAPEIN